MSKTAHPGTVADAEVSGCREDTPGQLTFDLISRNKHGLSGDLLLAELTFGVATNTMLGPTELDLPVIQLAGPSYEELNYNITAGGPVYAPTPMRALLDVQPCTADPGRRRARAALLEGFQGHAVGARRGRHGDPLLLPTAGGLLSDRRVRQRAGAGRSEDKQGAVPRKTGRQVRPLDGQAGAGTKTVTYEDDEGVAREGKVLPVAYHAVWPDLPPLLTVGETVYQRSKSGVSGVA